MCSAGLRGDILDRMSARRRSTLVLRLAPALLLALGALTPRAAALEDTGGPPRPAVLVHCARPSPDQWYWWVDLRYLAELHERGFEVDYTDRHSDFTWERVRRYDVLVIYTVPLERGAYYDNSPDRPPYRDEFIGIVERFLEAGGGVLLMARSLNGDESFLPLIRRWGARIPHERIVEDDPDRIAPMPRMRGSERLWFTDNVPPGPVSDGVAQVWLPLTEHDAALETMPIEVDETWRVVLRGSASSRTVPFARSEVRMASPPERRVRQPGESAPALMAIRDRGPGRIAFAAMWPQFSIGQGTQWLYERRVLSAGIGDRPSHFGRLLENVLRWLAESGGSSDAVGGFVTDPGRLVPPNLRAGVRERFVESSLRRPRPAAALDATRSGAPIRRGLIGAQSVHGSGAGSVADYARAAREAGLAFVVFLEDFASLDAERLGQLARECARESSEDLRLWPGYRIETNTGNTMFVYGDGSELPPPELVADGKLNLQYRDPASGEPNPRSPFIDWINYRLIAGGSVNVGYLGESEDPRAQPPYDLRFYSALAVQTWRDGALVADDLDAYLATAAGTIPPVPVAVHALTTPEALRAAARADAGLTRVQAGGADALWEALRYSGTYSSSRVFVSTGPTIHGWPQATQYYTFAAERFVAEAARMAVPLVVRSDVGLREVRVYDGGRLFRRFAAGGARSFEHVLELTASVQKTLIVVAEDVRGGKLVSAAWRAWKGGDLPVMFCGDRVNHCADPALMAKGPGIVQVLWAPDIIAGYTWDGGPRGIRPLLNLVGANRPTLASNRGTEGARGFANRAELESADEGAVRVRSTLERVYDEQVPAGNPWNVFGPIAGPSRLLRAEAVLTAFNRPTLGPHPEFWPGTARRAGASITLFEEDVTFRRKLRVDSLQLFRQPLYGGPFPVFLAHGRGDEVRRTLDLSPGRRPGAELELKSGEWIGVYGAEPSNLTVLWNRGDDLQVDFAGGAKYSALTFRAALEGEKVRAGQTRHYELLAAVDPVDEARTREPRVLEIVRYLLRPEALEVRRGRLDAVSGVVELTATDGAVELSVGRPESASGIPLPLRVSGLNPRWSAGVVLHRGYVLGNYGPGTNRYRDAGFDRGGRVWATLFPDLAPATHVEVGHPVVADDDELFVQVTRRDDRGLAESWHVSVNNPTDTDVRARFRSAMDLAGLTLPTQPVTIPAGGTVVLAGAE